MPLQQSVRLPYISALCFLAFIFIAYAGTAQSKKERNIIYEDTQVYATLGKYDQNNNEKKVSTVYIDANTGSYTYLSVVHPYLLFYAETYTVKAYRQIGKDYVFLEQKEFTFNKRVNHMRLKYLFSQLGKYKMRVYDSKKLLIGETMIECKSDKKNSANYKSAAVYFSTTPFVKTAPPKVTEAKVSPGNRARGHLIINNYPNNLYVKYLKVYTFKKKPDGSWEKRGSVSYDVDGESYFHSREFIFPDAGEYQVDVYDEHDNLLGAAKLMLEYK